MNPRRTFQHVRDFQSRSLGHSDTSPALLSSGTLCRSADQDALTEVLKGTSCAVSMLTGRPNGTLIGTARRAGSSRLEVRAIDALGGIAYFMGDDAGRALVSCVPLRVGIRPVSLVFCGATVGSAARTSRTSRASPAGRGERR